MRKDESLVSLLSVPRHGRELFLRNSLRAYTLAEALTRHCYAVRFQDAHDMLDAGRLAVEVAGRLSASQTRRAAGELRDLQAHAWGVLGNALRIRSCSAGAAGALTTAQEHLSAGTGKRRDLAALLLEFSAALHRSRGEYGEAQDRLACALQLRAALEDRQGVGKVRIQQGIGFGAAGDPERAVLLLVKGLSLVENDPDLSRAGFQSLIWHLIEARRVDRAHALLKQARGLLAEGGHLFQLKLRWLEARLKAATGSRDFTVALHYKSLHRAFAMRGLMREADLVALDLERLNGQRL